MWGLQNIPCLRNRSSNQNTNQVKRTKMLKNNVWTMDMHYRMLHVINHIVLNVQHMFIAASMLPLNWSYDSRIGKRRVHEQVLATGKSLVASTSSWAKVMEGWFTKPRGGGASSPVTNIISCPRRSSSTTQQYWRVSKMLSFISQKKRLEHWPLVYGEITDFDLRLFEFLYHV